MSFKNNSRTSILGVDTGGTFTDFVYFQNDGNEILLKTHKVLSTPSQPELAIMTGIRDMQIPLQGLRLIHGSTVATNAVLEGKGAKTVYITNRGMKDILTIGRQARKELYNLQPIKPSPPVPEIYCLETGGRLSASGDVIEDLADADLDQLRQEVLHCDPQAVAINLLFSFLDGRFEQQIMQFLPNHLFISCSHEIMPEYREYERGVTTWLNAYVGPLVQGYLQKLENEVLPARVSVMRSSGQTCQVQQAGKEAVNLLLSGPAGGLNAARYIAAAAGEKQLLTFDMGGTSTDVAMIDGDIVLSNQSSIAGFPVGVPMVDMHTIGAGGGSIAIVDVAQGLHVGPESAGANPGPACYGQGGDQATVTDANLVLGRLPGLQKLAGEMPLQVNLARHAISKLQNELGIDSIENVAEGIVNLANEAMSKALRVISVERGVDPRQFALMAFGGAGGLHACALADSLEIQKVIVAPHSGVLSALGMLVAPAGRVMSKTIAQQLNDCDVFQLEKQLHEIQQKGMALLEKEGHATEDIIADWSLDLCYKGQASTLNLCWRDWEQLESEFHYLHRQKYGHQLQRPIEIVNLRVMLRSGQDFNLQQSLVYEQIKPVHVSVFGIDGRVPVFYRNALEPDHCYPGPIIVVDALSTVFVDSGWICVRHESDCLLLSREFLGKLS